MGETRTIPWTVGRLALLAGAGLAAVLTVAGIGLGAFGKPSPPPAPRISSGPMRTTVARTATFAFVGATAVTFECSLDGRAFRACPQRVTYRRLGLGPHEFRVRARTLDGVTGTPAPYSWRILRPRPHRKPAVWRSLVARPVMTVAPVRPYFSRRATFAWRARPGWHWKPGTTFQCALDRRGWKRCRTPRTYIHLWLGKHVFRVRAKEPSGRVSRPNSFHWTITRAPAPAPVEFTARPDEVTESRDATFAFEADDGEATECRLDNGPWESCASPVLLVGLPLGVHIFCARALGPVGNPGPDMCVAWMIAPPAGGGPPPAGGSFTIAGNLAVALAPGVGGPLALTVTNPYGTDLSVTHLVVTVSPGSSNAGCDGPANLQVTQSNVSPALPLVVPAHSSVALPAHGVTAPTVTMRNLPVNQDACKGATFAFAYLSIGTGTG
jgi:hypothetical protein